ncbi:MAG: hypothetical protein JXB60_09840, partial [Candidatus Cloacimonetes bacterium]|nr:hypothetical protein [Candidatus Cloacimonadota bacterium]
MNKNRKFLLFLSVICLLVIMLQAEKVSSGPATEIVITGFLEGSSLQTAGADIGDILIEYNGQKIKDIQHLGALKEGVTTERVDVVLQRNKKLIKVNIPAGQLGVYLRAFYPDHKFDRDAVIIPDIGRLDWNIGMENSFLAAVYRIDEKLGSNMSYQDMVGISGYGFRLHFFDGWCPSSPDATCGYLCGDELLQDLGYDFTTYLLEGTEVDEDYQDALRSADELSTIIKTSIDNGWPVIALDLIEVPEWGIITG